MKAFEVWQPFIDQHGFVLLDGGLATELEFAGHDLDDALWSAKLLLEAPQAIEQVHADYLAAGADVIIAATYQATFAGLMQRGLGWQDSAELMLSAVQLAQSARAKYASSRHPRPLVAASIGPYGAYLADGSEYHGNYGLSVQELVDFHAARWHLLANSGADMLACETLPAFDEAQALLNLLQATPDTSAWFAFSCRDEHHINDGTAIAECGRLLDQEPRVAAIGINCTRPQFVTSLLDSLRTTTDKPLIVYPNSGECWDADGHCWLAGSEQSIAEYVTMAAEWRKHGATIIGGCCRTTPQHIQALKAELRP